MRYLALFGLAVTGLGLHGAQPHPLMEEYNRAWQLTGQLRAEEAIPLLKQIIVTDKTFHRAYFTLTEAYYQKRDLDGAEEFFRSLTAHDPENGQAHYGIGEVHRRRKKWGLAAHHYGACIQKSPRTIPCYEQMVAAVKSERKHTVTERDLQTSLFHLKSPFQQLLLAAMHRAAFSPAIPAEAKGALAIARSRNDYELIALLEYWIGDWCDGANKHRTAVEHFKIALETYRELDDEEMQFKITRFMAADYIRLKNFDRGRFYLDKSLALARKLGHHFHVAVGLIELGAYYKLRGDAEAALGSFQEAKQEFEALHDSTNALNALLQIGAMYDDIGDVDRARESFAECRATARKEGLKWHEAFALRRLGDIYRDSGEYVKALASLDEAVRIFREEAYSINVAAGLRVIASVHSALGNYSHANHWYEQSLADAGVFADTEQQERTLQGIGRLHLRMEQPKQALQYLQRALLISNRSGRSAIRSSTLVDLGNAFRMLGDLQAATTALSEGLRIARQLQIKSNEALALTALGRSYLDQGLLPQAEGYFRQSLTLAQESGITEVILASREGLAQIWVCRGRLVEALQHLQPAIATIESLRTMIPTPDLRVSFVHQNSRVYEMIVEVLSQLHARNPRAGYDRLAFAYVERGRARAFLDLLAESKAGISRGLTAEQVRQRNHLHVKLSKASAVLLREGSVSNQRAVESLERQLAEWARLLRRTNPRFHELQYPKPYDAAKAQSALAGSDAVLLEFTLGERQSLVWIVTAAGTRMVSLPPRADIEQEVASFRAASGRHPRADFDGWQVPARRLHQMLIAPVESLLHEAQHLVIVPDGALFYLPFEALVSTKTGSTRFLIEDHAVTYAPSASVYGNLLAERRASGRARTHELLAYGNPMFNVPSAMVGGSQLGDLVRGVYQSAGISFPALPNTQTEVETIGALYPPARRKIYLGRNATEASVKREDLRAYTRLHFATHAVLDEEVSARSGVVLSLVGTGDEDGILRTSEIFNLDLNADLVVLSACQTGLGTLVKGEGMVGLTRAFLYAGSPRVVVSLWEVNDQMTAEFMRIFYLKMKDKRSPGVALREAKLELLRSGLHAYRHPYFWTPFVLVGIL